MTTFGSLEINRTGLLPSKPADASVLAELGQKKIVYPLDEILGIANLPFKISVESMVEIVHWVQLIPSYEGAEEAIKRNTKIVVDADTIRGVANHIGNLVFQEDQAKADYAWNLLNDGQLDFPDKKKPYILYIMVDGAMIHIRKDEDSKNIPAEPGTEDKKSVWMENKLGLVCSTDNFSRYKNKKTNEYEYKIGPREYTTLLGTADEFKKHLLATALRNGYGEYEQTILLSDGATWIRKIKNELFPDAQQILDLYHLCEKVSNYSKNVFDNDEKLYKPWSDTVIKLLKESRLKEAYEEIDKLGKRRLSKSDFSLAGYLKNNEDNVDYAAYSSKGWIVGSGAIESSNRTVLQQRLKQSGMRWNIKSAQYILTLMSKAKCNLWDRDVVKLAQRKYGTISDATLSAMLNIMTTSCETA
jgi:hypothetical protein